LLEEYSLVHIIGPEVLGVSVASPNDVNLKYELISNIIIGRAKLLQCELADSEERRFPIGRYSEVCRSCVISRRLWRNN
jgi:hypothetical protein